ncbi:MULTISPECIES: hypothetical protein [unclassified Isoptericola]|uniref:hypothetical protein n=1 Tax=unclassified Isoptericola TaxID=2623355 RepID=UPI002713D59F|nr:MULTISPECIES: hypothetical protein [unclassified Isoptericola]MDO8142973.1 hypothetical protein [Isoptericola sp. 178]MDO8146834.1 hypothetical protein [Isoptericola sp. b515]MDO8150851.1 hypothetical protein [Isoptericola sp. b408]
MVTADEFWARQHARMARINHASRLASSLVAAAAIVMLVAIDWAGGIPWIAFAGVFPGTALARSYAVSKKASRPFPALRNGFVWLIAVSALVSSVGVVYLASEFWGAAAAGVACVLVGLSTFLLGRMMATSSRGAA